jgi:hypothetical protein
MPEIVPVMCNMNCKGLKNLCMTDVKLIVEDGDIAFMLYSVHVLEQVKSYGYKVIAKYQGEVPLGIYIMLKNTEFLVEV